MGILRGNPPGEVAGTDPRHQEAIRAHVADVVSSPAFATGARSAQILSYICARALAGKGSELNEYAIGVDVFERPASFDPRLDSIVRAEISRLRKRLREYYAGEGHGSAVEIQLPLRSYVPAFVVRDGEKPDAKAIEPAPVESRPKRRMRVMPWAASLVFLCLALTGIWMWKHRSRSAASPAIAVLPFLNLSGDPSQEYLGDSITEELTEALSESRALRVVARTSSFQFKNKSDDVRDIGRKLNVGSILEGSIRRRGDELQVIAQLIRTSDGFHLWSRTYQTTGADLSHVETEIVESSEQMLLPPRRTEARTHIIASANPQAHDLYLRSFYQYQLGTPESMREALALAEKAVAADPSYVRAYGEIATIARQMETFRLITPSEAQARGSAALETALRLDPGYSQGHALMAMDAYTKGWDWPRAEREFKLALAAEGSRGPAHNLYGWCLITRKRFREAREHLQIAEELDPLSLGPRSNLAEDWILEGKFPEARREIDGMLKLNPKSYMALTELRWIAVLRKDCQGAEAVERRLSQWYPNVHDPGAAVTDITCGNIGAARTRLAEFETRSASQFVSAYTMAECYAMLNDSGKAMEYLDKSAEQRQDMILYLQLDSILDPLRRLPGFIALEQRVGLIE